MCLGAGAQGVGCGTEAVMVCTSSWSRSAAVGDHMALDASKWGDWDLGADTGQTGCLSLVTRGIHLVYMCIYILTRGPLFCSARERIDMKLLVLFVLLWMSVICVSGHVYTYTCTI